MIKALNDKSIKKLEALCNDDAFLSRLKASQSMTDVQAAFHAHGLELDSGELKEMLECLADIQRQGGELPDELAACASGGSPVMYLRMACNFMGAMSDILSMLENATTPATSTQAVRRSRKPAG